VVHELPPIAINPVAPQQLSKTTIVCLSVVVGIICLASTLSFVFGLADALMTEPPPPVVEMPKKFPFALIDFMLDAAHLNARSK
jgi:hypothetical protein